MTHTPGPWKYVPWHIEEDAAAVRAPEGWLICQTSSDDDARLIAAAPDMLEALKEIEQRGHTAVQEIARATIAKATL